MPALRTGRAAGARGRRPDRPSGDDREAAILATAERLLAERPLSAISVDDLARGAGISRPTFYFYFRSKDAVLLSILDRVVAEADAASAAAFAAASAQLPSDARERWGAMIESYHATFRAHRSVMLAAAELRFTNAEVRDLWNRVSADWVRACADAIEAERRRGAAPPGLPARDLSVVLNQLNERVLYGTLSGDGPSVPEDDVVGVLLDVWLSAIYSPPAPRPPRDAPLN
jgi:TetR/AcrR family transcriptional regulator, ethionamide resistance regulator